MSHETIRDKRANTICWKCAKACGGCAWSDRAEPIEGWTAEQGVIKIEPGRYVETYEVVACPQFVYEPAHEFKALDPDGIKALAVAVLTRTIRDRKELKKQAEWDEEKRSSIEHQIKYLEKAFDPDGLWMQLAGIDESGADKVLKGDRKPFVPQTKGDMMANKYNARKTSVDGITFDSAKEAKRYTVLRDMERRGEIRGLRMQVPFTLIPAQKAPSGKTERAVKYVADFCYTDADNHLVVEDVKGYRRGAGYNVFRLKAKLMLHKYGIEIKEV